ncbi:hypothetical protein FRAHR75_520036 [Frankia sp. Hr75.2]|nr:hypothetical protein FRAHR75_520036 [Frankia sp. Hr75.2]
MPMLKIVDFGTCPTITPLTTIAHLPGTRGFDHDMEIAAYFPSDQHPAGVGRAGRDGTRGEAADACLI